jgi:hypothetical protein
MSERSIIAEPDEPCRGIKGVRGLEVDTDVTDDKMAALLLQFEGLLDADWWMALVTSQYHTTK